MLFSWITYLISRAPLSLCGGIWETRYLGRWLIITKLHHVPEARAYKVEWSECFIILGPGETQWKKYPCLAMVFTSAVTKYLSPDNSLSYSNSDVLTLLSLFLYSVKHFPSVRTLLHTGEIHVHCFPLCTPRYSKESNPQKHKEGEKNPVKSD